MAKAKRKKLFVDSNVQGALLRRIVLYWVCCLSFVILPLLIGRAIMEPDRLFYEQFGDLWSTYWPVFLAVLLLLPFTLYDVLKLSNRFVGPLFRLRREMGRLANGDAAEHIRFRDNDYWPELAETFNQIADRLAEKERRCDCVTSRTDCFNEASQQPEVVGCEL